MESMKYGKVGWGFAVAGLILGFISILTSLMFGWIIREIIIYALYVFSFILIIAAIIFGIYGILKDESRLKAIESLIGGIIELVLISFFMVIYIQYV
ncbi:MAG: hypothetical protein ACFE96_02195 [Candidatus Hermodarchaeota archaeon]